MKNRFVRVIAGLAIAIMGASSHASLIAASWEDHYDASVKMNSWGETVAWTFDISKDGFNAGHDLVTNYSIDLRVRDDSGYDWYERAYFDQPGILGDRFFEVDFSDVGVGFSLAGLLSINLDGMLDVSLTRKSGDFWFNGSDLYAHGFSKVSVPEPGTLILLSLGLGGLLVSRRLTAKT